MNIRNRLDKLEKRTNNNQQLAVIILQPGMNKDVALSDWKRQTGRPEPGLVVFIQRFSYANAQEKINEY